MQWLIIPINHRWLSGRMKLHWLQFKLILIPRGKQWERDGARLTFRVRCQQVDSVGLWVLVCMSCLTYLRMSWGQSWGLGSGSPFDRCLGPMSLLFQWDRQSTWLRPAAWLPYCTTKEVFWAEGTQDQMGVTSGHLKWDPGTQPCVIFTWPFITLWFVRSWKLEGVWQKYLEG